MKNNSLLLAVMSAALVSGCSTLDAINPFDKTEAAKRAEQGEVAGEDQAEMLERLLKGVAGATLLGPQPIVDGPWAVWHPVL